MNVHPSFLPFLEEYHRGPDFCDLSPQENRDNLNRMFEPVAYPEELTRLFVKDYSVPVDDDEITVRLYKSTPKPQPGFMWFHGGGYVIGSIHNADYLCRLLACQTNRAILSVGYRLAPEYRFPVPVRDGFLASKWALDNCGELGLLPDQLGIGGSSAGGTLAVACCLMWRDIEGIMPLQHQFILAPAFDLDFSRPSYMQFGSGHFMTKKSICYFFEHFYSDDAEDNPYFLPGYARSFFNLPPALVVTAECDPLRDEGHRYYEILTNHDVSTEYLCLPATIHGFSGLARNNPYAEKMLMKTISAYEHFAKKIGSH